MPLSKDKNREYQRLYIKKRRKKRKLLLLEGKICERCGFNDIRALEFHHKNPEEKLFTIGNNLIKPLKELLEEIKKCEIICANCHAIEHDVYLSS